MFLTCDQLIHDYIIVGSFCCRCVINTIHSFLLHTLSFYAMWGASSTSENNKHKMKSAMHMNSQDIFFISLASAEQRSICWSEYDCKIIDLILLFISSEKCIKYYIRFIVRDQLVALHICVCHIILLFFFSFHFKNCSQPENVKLERFALHFII